MKLSRPVPPAEPDINENADAALGRLESLVMPNCELCNWPAEYGHEIDCPKARKRDPLRHGRCNEADCEYPNCDCWERKELRPLLKRHAELGKFYGTNDYVGMVDLMTAQIERLQERLRDKSNGKPPMLRA